MSLPKEKVYTTRDIYSLQEGQRAELIKHHSSGVKEYWIVDPEKDRILVYDFDHEETGEYTFKE